METELFRGAKLKVKRANQHIGDLNSTIGAFFKAPFYPLRVEKDVQTGKNSLTFEMTRGVPDEIPLLIGDAIHNLRAALDHVVYELIKLNHGTPSQWTGFPCRKRREELEPALRKRIEEGLPHKISAFIQDVIKPYEGGNDPLYTLHNLDVTDKHKLIILTFAVAGVIFLEDKGSGVLLTEATFPAEKGRKVRVTPILNDISNMKEEEYGKPTLNVLFGDSGEVFKGRPVVPTLHQFSEVVSGVIQSIAKTYLAGG